MSNEQQPLRYHKMHDATEWPIERDAERVEFVLRETLEQDSPEAVCVLTAEEARVTASCCNAYRSLLDSPWKQRYYRLQEDRFDASFEATDRSIKAEARIRELEDLNKGDKEDIARLEAEIAQLTQLLEAK